MSDTENQPVADELLVDIEEQRRWAREHRTATGMSGEEFAKRVGRAWGTLSQFLGKGYNGNEQVIADQIWSYRQMLTQQSLFKLDLPKAPKFYMTPTANDILNSVSFAHTYRRFCAIGTGAGMGKSRVFEHYQDSFPQVFLATMSKSSAGVMNMQLVVLKALGIGDPKGSPYKLSQMIMEKLRYSGGLLIIDEGQHLEVGSIEEIRSWFDASEIECRRRAGDDDKADFGVVLGGNISMMQRIEGNARGADFAQIFSRNAFKLLRLNAVRGDADAMCAAWGIDDEKIVAAIRDIVAKPGALRQATFVLELANLMAAGAGVMLDSSHVRESWAQLSMRPIAA